MKRLFSLKDRIDPGNLDVPLHLHPARIAEREGSQNVHSLMESVNEGSPTDGSSTHANTEWHSMPLNEGCGIQRFKRVEHHQSSPREFDEPVANEVPNKGARVEVGWDSSAGQGRGEGDVDE